jgi:hypothetical protein
MNFDFIPYKLNIDINNFKGQIQYISSDNGVDLYRAEKAFKMPLKGITLSNINLYFLDGNLITVYIHIVENTEDLREVIKTLESLIEISVKALRVDSGMVHFWCNEYEFLGVIEDRRYKRLKLYYTLMLFNVFEGYLR